MFKAQLALIFLLIVCGNAWSADQFCGIQCGTDIARSLVGRQESADPVAVIEARHKDMAIKDLGRE
jgi:hypothetical protein